MTRADALSRADECDRLQRVEIDPERQILLGSLRKFWLTVADCAAEMVDFQYENVLALHQSLVAGKS